MTLRPRLVARRHAFSTSSRRWQTTPKLVVETPKTPPLRILFCGSDEFSIYSLYALYKLPSTIVKSIDVVCKTPRRTGRGLKNLTSPLIAEAATAISLPLHQISTFTSWAPPRPIDLIIAVSFGLLIPPRILSLARYGGLNVHPSFLPDLYGPAPIHWAMLHRDQHTGVTVQTLHPREFDQGHIVAQSERPGVNLVYASAAGKGPLARNVERLGLLGADVLRDAIVEGRFLDLPETEKDEVGKEGREGARHARKVKPMDRKFNAKEWDAEHVLLRDAVLGRLWNDETFQALKRIQVEAEMTDEAHINAAIAKAQGKRTVFNAWQDFTDEVLDIRRRDPTKRKLWHERIRLPGVSGKKTLDGESRLKVGMESRGSTEEHTASKDSVPDSAAKAGTKEADIDGTSASTGEAGSELVTSDTTPATLGNNVLLLCLEPRVWILVFRTKDGRYVGPQYAKAEGSVTVPIGVYISGAVTAVINRRRKDVEKQRGVKTMRLPRNEHGVYEA
ncbi:methionyl-tRNA formyltransferase [Sphaceloma murrayae]|uniref:methionyl-tRNA formyltransferase n=1 Tax=Sphaceloma murrayae TaxID=2082308 RepID=A0A2K1QFZ6_9PEZI|nr:methionyl-tRNA formyltransferase [Sphaceloma murrayae]